MANLNVITGVDIVIRNMKVSKEKIATGVQKGLRAAGLSLQRASQLLVPVEFGPLKASARTRSEGSGLGTVVTVEYTAAYAIYVHENVEMKWRGKPRKSGKGAYWDPPGRGQAKFLEQPARSMGPELKQTILDSIDMT